MAIQLAVTSNWIVQQINVKLVSVRTILVKVLAWFIW